MMSGVSTIIQRWCHSYLLNMDGM